MMRFTGFRRMRDRKGSGCKSWSRSILILSPDIDTHNIKLEINTNLVIQVGLAINDFFSETRDERYVPYKKAKHRQVNMFVDFSLGWISITDDLQTANLSWEFSSLVGNNTGCFFVDVLHKDSDDIGHCFTLLSYDNE